MLVINKSSETHRIFYREGNRFKYHFTINPNKTERASTKHFGKELFILSKDGYQSIGVANKYVVYNILPHQEEIIQDSEIEDNSDSEYFVNTPIEEFIPNYKTCKILRTKIDKEIQYYHVNGYSLNDSIRITLKRYINEKKEQLDKKKEEIETKFQMEELPKMLLITFLGLFLIMGIMTVAPNIVGIISTIVICYGMLKFNETHSKKIRNKKSLSI